MLLWARGISKYALTLRYELIQLKTICVFAELGLIWFIVDWIIICQLEKFFDFGLHWVVLATDTLFPYYRSGFTHNWSYLEHYMPLNGHTPNEIKTFCPSLKKDTKTTYYYLSLTILFPEYIHWLSVTRCCPVGQFWISAVWYWIFFSATWRQSCCSRDGNKWSFTNNT